MSDPTWIRQAMNAGGTLTVKPPIPGKSIFRAVMSWKGEADVKGEISTSLSGALESLDKALMEDAAKEMIEKGAV